MNAWVASNARQLKIPIAVPLAIEVAFFAWLVWYINPLESPTELIFRFLQFLLPIAALLAIPSAMLIAMIEGRSSRENRLVGWEKVRRVLSWYTGMAMVAVAGYLSVRDINYWVGERPIYDPLVRPLNFIFGVYYYGAFVVATFLYIAMDGPLLCDRDITSLPRRATIVLSCYTLTSILWFMLAFIQPVEQYDPILFSSLIVNVLAIIGLWMSRWLLQFHCNAGKVILWNTAFVAWVVLFAHPPIIFESFWP